jgi:hypothetical protein
MRHVHQRQKRKQQQQQHHHKQHLSLRQIEQQLQQQQLCDPSSAWRSNASGCSLQQLETAG